MRLPNSYKQWLIILLLALVLGGFASRYASSYPDGLEKNLSILNVQPRLSWVYNGPYADYLFTSPWSENASQALAGLLGTGMVFLTLLIIGRFLQYRKKQPTERR